MHIRILNPNVKLDDGVLEYVEEHLNRHVKKYFENAVNADVHFSKQRNNFHVNIIINEGIKGGGIDIKSNAEGADAYGCFNEAMEKAAKQLRRYKDRIKNYRREKGGLKNEDFGDLGFESQKYILAPYNLLEEIEEEELSAMKEEESVKIIGEKTTKIEELTLNQAIMKMDLANLPALVFINKQNKRLNVVYHRKDGNISWIDANVG
jgi:ribosomal subunit interface protein